MENTMLDLENTIRNTALKMLITKRVQNTPLPRSEMNESHSTVSVQKVLILMR